MRRSRAAARGTLIQCKEASQTPAVSGRTGIELWNRVREVGAAGGKRLEAKIWELGNLVGEEPIYGSGRQNSGGRGRVG